MHCDEIAVCRVLVYDIELTQAGQTLMCSTDLTLRDNLNLNSVINRT